MANLDGYLAANEALDTEILLAAYIFTFEQVLPTIIVSANMALNILKNMDSFFESRRLSCKLLGRRGFNFGILYVT